MEKRRVEKGKKRRKIRRVLRPAANTVIIILILYLILMAVSLFGGEGGVPSALREYEFIEVPADYIEENLILIDSGTSNEADDDHLEVVINENVIYVDDEEISLDDLLETIAENDIRKVTLTDDSAKRVTYAEVYDELEKLDIIIEEN